MSIIRDLTAKLEPYLPKDEMIILVGARQAGKTTILYQLKDILEREGKACHFLNLEDPDYLSLLNQSPKNLFQIFPFDLKTKNFLLIDEVQYLDKPSNFLKYFYDTYRGKIKIVASGSSAFYLDKKFNDSLAGRKMIFNVWTLCFREFLKFKGEDELSGRDFRTLTLSEKEKVGYYYQEYLVFGGYPKVVLSPAGEKEKTLEEIVFSYIKKDIFESGVRQDEIFYRLLKILASQVGSLVNASELASTLGVSKKMIDNYLYVMQKSFHLHLLKPFFKNLRKELTKMPKVYFFDLGLRNFLTRNFEAFGSRNDKGSLLENAVFRELLERRGTEDVLFWRTTGENEVDFVLEKEKMALEAKVQPEKFKKAKYKIFFENYPQFKLSIVTLNKKKETVFQTEVLEPWEL